MIIAIMIFTFSGTTKKNILPGKKYRFCLLQTQFLSPTGNKDIKLQQNT